MKWLKGNPPLRGKDLERFEREIELNKTRKVPEADYLRAMAVYKRVNNDS